MGLEFIRKAFGNTKSRTKYKCAAPVCEIIINVNKVRSKYCDFHRMVQDFHIKFAESKNPAIHKTEMYMNMNGNIFNTVKLMDRTKNELSKELK